MLSDLNWDETLLGLAEEQCKILQAVILVKKSQVSDYNLGEFTQSRTSILSRIQITLKWLKQEEDHGNLDI